MVRIKLSEEFDDREAEGFIEECGLISSFLKAESSILDLCNECPDLITELDIRELHNMNET